MSRNESLLMERIDDLEADKLSLIEEKAELEAKLEEVTTLYEDVMFNMKDMLNSYGNWREQQ